ncbi:30S ribosomal protein S1 [Atopobacter phocae]|uniref:30S ribosomal protein S1 n=1 Tax=Atopobacter phocae TaxID=136492 RepID=UPI00046EE015|nr:30S ribosomal protein S1 [Atopobacter phocae]
MTELENNAQLEQQEIGSETQTMEDALEQVQEISIGDVVMGEVLSIQDDNQVIVGIIGSGVEGVVPRNELSATSFDSITDIVTEGDEVELVVIKSNKDKENGSFTLSRKRLESKKVWDEIQTKFENGETVTAPVKDVVKGGLVVDLGVRGFVPASMVANYYVDDFSSYKGQELEFKIIEIEPSENRLILSRKELAEAEQAEKRNEFLQEVEEGSILEGTVARLTNFGAFIDLGSVDGLVHISQIAHHHVKNPADELTIGDKVQVKVLAIDLERGRVSLSIKETQAGPWEALVEEVSVDDVLAGTVKRLTAFGAFVEVRPGVEGLVHISQISHDHIATPNDKLKEGQEVQVKVLDIKPEDQRLSLSIKALEEKPAEEKPAASKPKKQAKPQKQVEMPEDESGFTLGDLLGDQLANFANEDN